MARESSLWRWLSSARLEYREALHIQRIENLIGRGAPDVEGHLLLEGQFWIELKSCRRPVGGGKLAICLRPEQVRWAKRRHDAGGWSWLLIQVGSGRRAERYLIPGHMGSCILDDDATEEWLAHHCVLREDGINAKSPPQILRRASRAP